MAYTRSQVLLCGGTGCTSSGSRVLEKEFIKEIKNSGLQDEVEVAVTGCFGLCSLGPVVIIYPEGTFYSMVKPEDVAEIVHEHLVKGRPLARLEYKETKGDKVTESLKELDFYNKQTRVALKNCGIINPEDIEDYIGSDGYTALEKVLLSMQPQDVINEIKASGLRGRGGGGFPTGVKWETCHKIDRWPKYIICNGDEGDPGAFMDRSVMEGDPHTVLEGMIIASVALNVRNGFIYIRDEYGLALENMRRAIEQAKEFNYLGDRILGSEHSFDIEIVRGGGAFVCGESSALMASIEGRAGEPRAKYIRSAEFGLWGQPTVLNNVETWANVPVILDKGSEWFSQIGSLGNAGTKVFSLVGKVKNTGLVEVPMGITLEELIFDIGGGIVGDREFKAVQTGGPSGGCIPKELMHLGVDFDTLEAAGSMMGSGGMIVTDERTCMVEFARYYVAFLAEESCGKCVSCREGIRQMQKILTDICEGRGQESDLDLLTEIAHTVRQASLCGLGKTAPNPVLSTLKYFRDEYMEHIANGRCRAGVCKALTEFYIDPDLCTGCGACKKGCAPEAIEGRLKEPHVLDREKCIKCGSCIDVCRFKAVKVR